MVRVMRARVCTIVCAAALAGTLAFGLAGCASSSDVADAAETPAVEQQVADEQEDDDGADSEQQAEAEAPQAPSSDIEQEEDVCMGNVDLRD